MTAEAFLDCKDSELKHAVFCSNDHALFKKNNENFELTRTSTLMIGTYCDFCLHDTRIVDKIEHPSKEFIENLCK